MAMRLGNNSTVYGIDTWEDAFHKVNEKLGFYGVKNIKLIKGNVESIPLDNGSVDLITSNNCINNLQDIKKGLMECHRILKNNGQFIFSMNTEKTMIEYYDIMEQTLLELNLLAEIDIMYKHIEQKRPSVEKIKEQMENNFIIKDIEKNQFFYKFSNGTAMFNHHFIKVAFMETWKSIVPEARISEIFGIMENKFNILAKETCGIKLSVPYVVINSYKK